MDHVNTSHSEVFRFARGYMKTYFEGGSLGKKSLNIRLITIIVLC
jgi:hypothetical protein